MVRGSGAQARRRRGSDGEQRENADQGGPANRHRLGRSAGEKRGELVNPVITEGPGSYLTITTDGSYLIRAAVHVEEAGPAVMLSFVPASGHLLSSFMARPEEAEAIETMLRLAREEAVKFGVFQ